MKAKIALSTTLTIFLISALVSMIDIPSARAGKIIVPDDYPSIQEAINVANPGDTIFVRGGYYYGNVFVNKTVSLVGENAENTTIDGAGVGNVVTVVADNVNVTGFTMRDSGVSDAGITLDSASYCKITENVLTDNKNGVYLGSCSHSTFSGNKITNNDNGIRFRSSSDNAVSGNNITSNNGLGIWLDSYSNGSVVSGNSIANNVHGVYLGSCSRSTVSGNNITNNDHGVYLSYSSNNFVFGNSITNNGFGGELHYSSNNTISGNNIVNNVHGVGLYYSSGNNVSENNIRANDDYGIWLYYSVNSAVFENNVTANNYQGLGLYYSNESTISGNNITSNNVYGLWLSSSLNNTISGNNVTNNRYGVYLQLSYGDKFFHNKFINNTQQVNSTSSGNASIWDDGYPSGGNYWSDCADVDLKSGPYQNETGSDGIWDHTYVIDSSNKDNYPIIPEFTPFVIPLLFITTSLSAIIVSRRKKKIQSPRSTSSQGMVGWGKVLCTHTIKTRTKAGSINLGNVNGTVTAHSSAGSITFKGTLSETDSWFRSNLGSIDITLDKRAGLTVEASTNLGTIKCIPELTDVRYERGRQIGRIGTGKGKLVVETNLGSITIRS